MAAPPNTAPPGAGEGAKDGGVEVCLFDESLDGFSRTVRAISELTTGEPELDCPQAEVERIASSVTFLREWRHFTYDPKGVSFTDDSEPASSRNGMHNITLPQLSSASVPQITQHEDQKDNMASFDFVLFAGGNVWALDWCPRLSDKPGSSINCEYLAVSAHPPGSSYHKLGMPLSGRGLIQVWCLLAPFEDEYSYKSLDACNKNSRRGRPRKIPGGNNTVSSSSNPPKPRGRPRKIPDENNPVSSSSNPPKPRGRPRKRPIDISEPVAKRPRGRPRKYPLPVAVVDDSSLNSRSQDIVPFDPLSTPTVAPDDLPLATETESGKDTTCQPVDHTACTESDTYLSITAVDAALPIISSSTATCERSRKQNEELISSSNDPAVSVENALPSGESNIVSATSEVCSVSGPSCEGIVHNGILSDNFVTPNHIPRGKKGRGRPRKNPFSTSTRFSGVSGGNSPKTASIHYDLDKSDGKFISSNLGSVSSCGLDIEKCSIHLNFSSPDDASPTHGLHNEECKESITRRGIGGSGKKHVSTEHCISIDLNDSEPRKLTTPKSNGNVPLVESFVEGSHPREDGRQHKNLSALNETSSSPIPKGIDGMKAAELVPFEEPREDDKNLSSIENSYSSPIPKDIALPRIVLCLAHNGKVAWDIKWKPLIANQPEQESCLGFLAVLLGNGSLEVWEVPSPRMIQKIYSPSTAEGSDPRFVKLQPVFRCAKVTRGNKQCIPLTVDWSPSPPHDLILAGCHDGTVALWKFSTNLLAQDSKPLMCVTADSVPVRALSWAPYMSEKNINTFVTAGDDGLKFWDLRDPYRPLWELTTAPRTVLSLHWLKVARGIVISLEDGTLKFLSLPRIANDVPITGRPFVGTKTQGVSTYQLSEYLIWSIHASEITGLAAYCGADGTAVRFELTSRFWEKEPGRNRAPYFLCGSLSEEGENIKIGINSRKSPLSNVPLGAKKAPKLCQDVVQMQNVERDRLQNITDSGDLLALTASSQNPELRGDKEDGHMEEHGAGAMVLAGQTEQANDALWNIKTGESPKDFEVFPPKSVALHRVRWNTNKGSERWLCYGGAAGIIRCQRI